MKKKGKPKTVLNKGPRMLPMVTLSDGKTYFIDDRLRQLRNIKNPNDYIDEYATKLTMTDLDEVWKQADDFTQFITVNCVRCRKTLFSGPEKDAKGLIIYCTDCYRNRRGTANRKSIKRQRKVKVCECGRSQTGHLL